MSIHVTVHFNASDVIAVVTALQVYRKEIESSDDDGKEQDILHIDNLIRKLSR